ncbi:MAG: phytoene desaturase family protein [Bacteroidota bacterium]
MSILRACVIGSGFSGLSVATELATKGHQVTILEKNDSPGGRARRFNQDGFTFDMGPSWYWMPDVFERYFERFGKKVSDYYQLDRLDPSYAVIFSEDEFVDIPAKMSEMEALFESYEKGSAAKLREFLSQAAYKYEVGINDLVYKPSRSVGEFMDIRLLRGVIKMDVFQSMAKHVRKFFTHPKLIELMEFPVLFLGALPENTPALYSLMNYADISLGTWYPEGGMFKIVEGMLSLAEEKGVKIQYNSEVTGFNYDKGKITHVNTTNDSLEFDVVVASADYNHVDQQLLDQQYANYSKKYWEGRTMAPSCLLYYLGVNKKLEKLQHHNLFFDTDFKKHAEEIYTTKEWPENPLFYVSVTSKTDKESAPPDMENVFLLIPVATGLEDTEEVKEKYFDMTITRLEKLTGQSIREHIVYKRAYAPSDFVADYHAFKGNAYGLANTLKQTAILKPGLKNKKLSNLYYTGQLTVPGPGVPPSIISGIVVANEVINDHH